MSWATGFHSFIKQIIKTLPIYAGRYRMILGSRPDQKYTRRIDMQIYIWQN